MLHRNDIKFITDPAIVVAGTLSFVFVFVFLMVLFLPLCYASHLQYRKGKAYVD
jgi:hypothetical protein